MIKNSNSLKTINFQQLKQPKTLTIVHFNAKRLTIPLFESCWNITKYLNMQLKNFQQKVLKNTKHATKQEQQIVCYKTFPKNSDIRMDIVLSLIRDYMPYGDLSEQLIRSNLEVNITTLFKYIEVQPYYGQNIGLNVNKKLPKEQYNYDIISILSKQKNNNVYLCQRAVDGNYVAIKVQQSSRKNSYNSQITLQKSTKHFLSIYDIFNYKQHQLTIMQYCPGGSLQNYWHYYNNKKQFPQQQCLTFLKQLLNIVSRLHLCNGMIHGNLVMGKIFVTLMGELKINVKDARFICKISNSNNNSKVKLSASNYKYTQIDQQQNKSFHATTNNQYSIQDNYFQNEDYHLQSYNIGYSTPPQVQNTKYPKFNSLVDYYNVGLVIYQLLMGKKYERYQKVLTKQELENDNDDISLHSILMRLLSDDLMIRGQVVSQLLISMRDQGYHSFSKDSNLIPINAIQIGESFQPKERERYHTLSQKQKPIVYNYDMYKKIQQAEQQNSYIAEQQLITILNPHKYDEQNNNYLDPMLNKKKISKSKGKKISTSNSKISTKIRAKDSDISLDKSKKSRTSKSRNKNQKGLSNHTNANYQSINNNKVNKQVSLQTVNKKSRQKNENKSLSKDKIISKNKKQSLQSPVNKLKQGQQFRVFANTKKY